MRLDHLLSKEEEVELFVVYVQLLSYKCHPFVLRTTDDATASHIQFNQSNYESKLSNSPDLIVH